MRSHMVLCEDASGDTRGGSKKAGAGGVADLPFLTICAGYGAVRRYAHIGSGLFELDRNLLHEYLTHHR
jgi:hypothetical protein